MKSPFLRPQMFALYFGAILWLFLLAQHAHASTASHDPIWDLQTADPIGNGIRWVGGKLQDWLGW